MAEFGVEQTDVAEIGNAVTPVQAQASEPIAVEGLTNLFKLATGFEKGKKEKAGQEFIAQFTNKQLSLVQAVEQGMDSKAARARLAVNLQSAIQTHPGLMDEIQKAQGFVLGKGGMGEVVFTGADTERQRQDLQDAMVKEGLVSPDATDEEFTQAEENFRVAAEADRRYKTVTETIALEKSKIGLDKSKLELLQAKQKEADKNLLVASAPAQMDQFQTTIKDVLDSVRIQGESQAKGITAINAAFTAMEAKAAKYFVNLDSTQTEALKKPFTMMRDEALAVITGERTTEEYQRNIDSLIAMNSSQLLSNPTIAKAVAASKLLPQNFPYQQIPEVVNAMSTMFNQALDGEGVNTAGTTENERKANRELFKMLTNKDLPDDQREEVGKVLAGVFEGVIDYQGLTARNPQGVVDLSNFMATQDFLQLRKEHPEAFKNLDTAKQVLNANYYDEVFQMVDKEFRTNKVQIGSLEGKVTGEGVNRRSSLTAPIGETKDFVLVRPSAQGMEFYAADPTNNFTVAKAKKLNKELRPVINRSIMAMAHLNGESNYSQLWEQVSERFMTGEGIATDEGDDLELSDVQEQSQQEVQQVTTTLLKEFEGFIPTPKWDVNALRVGYGSDTITLEDGTVKKVKEDEKVSKEDAERDLERRSRIFAGAARKKIGPEVWDSFPTDTIAALTSIAYNYGSIPSRILDEAKSGDLDALADAVEALGKDNKGINKKRRKKEADLIRASKG